MLLNQGVLRQPTTGILPTGNASYLSFFTVLKRFPRKKTRANQGL